MNDPSQPTPATNAYRITPVADQHVAESARMILAAAAHAGRRRAIVLGAGKCQEIPLAELTAQFKHVLLVDLDRAALDEGLASAALAHESRRKIDVVIADLTGLTDALTRRWREAIAGSPDPHDAIERFSAVADKAQPAMLGTNEYEPFDLLIASCLLSQLHAPAAGRAEQIFVQRFPADIADLRSAPRWVTSLEALARRIETGFMAWLPTLVAPGGRIYVSETVQVCLTELAPDGAWQTAGSYRMTKSLDLADYVDARYKIEERGRWSWVQAVPQPGQSGKLFEVQALTLSVNP